MRISDTVRDQIVEGLRNFRADANFLSTRPRLPANNNGSSAGLQHYGSLVYYFRGRLFFLIEAISDYASI